MTLMSILWGDQGRCAKCVRDPNGRGIVRECVRHSILSFLTDHAGVFHLAEDGGWYRDATVEWRFWLWGAGARQSIRRWRRYGYGR